MGTLTARFGLRKPATGDLYDVVADENYNSDIVDAAMGDRICTSSTRPSTSIYVGLRCFETDTKAVVVITSLGPTVWRYVTNPVVASAAAMAALSPLHAGMICSRSDVLVECVWNGSAWRQVGDAVMMNTRYIAGGDLAISSGITFAVTNMSTGSIAYTTEWVYEVEFSFTFTQSDSNRQYTLRVQDGGTGGPAMVVHTTPSNQLAVPNPQYLNLKFEYIPPSNTTKTFVGTMIQTAAGAGTINIKSDPGGATYVKVTRKCLAAQVINV